MIDFKQALVWFMLQLHKTFNRPDSNKIIQREFDARQASSTHSHEVDYNNNFSSRGYSTPEFTTRVRTK